MGSQRVAEVAVGADVLDEAAVRAQVEVALGRAERCGGDAGEDAAGEVLARLLVLSARRRRLLLLRLRLRARRPEPALGRLGVGLGAGQLPSLLERGEVLALSSPGAQQRGVDERAAAVDIAALAGAVLDQSDAGLGRQQLLQRGLRLGGVAGGNLEAEQVDAARPLTFADLDGVPVDDLHDGGGGGGGVGRAGNAERDR